jgi:predicted RNA-binding protein YlxR (DUF448 family)
MKSRERRCIVTGETPEESKLLRFALAPDGRVVPDVLAKAPGRGAWILSQRTHVEKAVRGNLFARAFKTRAEPAKDLADSAEAALAARCLSILGLGRKAAAIAIGFDQVDGAIRATRPLGLIEAVDGSADGRGKLLALARGLWSDDPPLVGCFSGVEIGVALGRDRVIHACWLQERMARLWAGEIARLAGFRAITPDGWGIGSWREAREAAAGGAAPS